MGPMTTQRGGSGSGKGVVCNVSGSVRLGWCPSHGVLFVLVWSVLLGSCMMLLVLLNDASDVKESGCEKNQCSSCIYPHLSQELTLGVANSKS